MVGGHHSIRNCVRRISAFGRLRTTVVKDLPLKFKTYCFSDMVPDPTMQGLHGPQGR